jgi:hypothetical protein
LLKKAFGGSEPDRRQRRGPEREFRPAKLPPRRSEQMQTATSSSGLRAVPRALVVSDRATGQVVYNMLTPHMQQFMGRCVGVLKRVGIAAKGTGQFSIMIGEQQKELRLDQFYQPNDDPAVVEHVVAEARRITNVV